MWSLFSKFNIIELSVYSAPPRPFLCLLSPLSCGSVISGTCPWTRAAPDKTLAIGAHWEEGIGCFARKTVVREDYLAVFELYTLGLITLRIDSHTDRSYQKTQSHV